MPCNAASHAYVIHAGIVFSDMHVMAAKTMDICHMVVTFLTFSLLTLFFFSRIMSFS